MMTVILILCVLFVVAAVMAVTTVSLQRRKPGEPLITLTLILPPDRREVSWHWPKGHRW